MNMTQTTTATIRIVSNYFVAGIILDNQAVCIEAAPILKWAIGKPIKELVDYFNKKNWKAKMI